MDVFTFISVGDTGVIGFTRDAEGDNLPADFAPWQRLGTGQAMHAGGNVAGPGGADLVLRAIEEHGYFLARGGEVSVTRHFHPRR